jgi:predicted RNase H-like nuclease
VKDSVPYEVAGVDGCKAGWCVAIALTPGKPNRPQLPYAVSLKSVSVKSSFADVLSATNDCKMVCVDMPIGLGEKQMPRECDRQARRLLGARRASTVFFPPTRQCLSARQYRQANSICLKSTGKGLSKQGFALLEKIREVDNLMTPRLQQRVCEIHPELSFHVLNGNSTIAASKKTVPGQAVRRRLLQAVFGDIDNVLADAPAQGLTMDDALDAIVAAWTGWQVTAARASTLPVRPPRDAKGLKMEIVLPQVMPQTLESSDPER